MDYTLKKLLGGIANGKDVPGDWELISEWVEPGTGISSIYGKRDFILGDDRFTVWVESTVPEPVFQAIMQWHREMYRGDLVEAQKDLLKESITAAISYTTIIMVVGYAALFAFWSFGEDRFTPATLFWSGILLAISVFVFVGFELAGMIIRARINLAIAEAVRNPAEFEMKMRTWREAQGSFVIRFQRVWIWTVGAAAGAAVLAFGVMLSAMVHGVWVNFTGHDTCNDGTPSCAVVESQKAHAPQG